MKKKLALLLTALFSLSGLSLSAQNVEEVETVNLSVVEEEQPDIVPNWFANNVNIVWAQKTRYAPSPQDNLYLEYELMGRQGIFDFYGYVDLPKTFGVGKNIEGIWDCKGSRTFADLQGRMSINGLLGKPRNSNAFLKEYFVAANYIGDFGNAKYYAASHSLWYGLGTTVNTHSDFRLDVNFYLRKTFNNYGSGNEHSWKGYRVKMNWGYPICSMFKGQGALNYIGFGDYDFGLDKRPKERPSDDIGSNDALQVSNVLDVSYKKFHISAVLRYWYHGGENRYNGGSFPVRTNGFGYYIVAGMAL